MASEIEKTKAWYPFNTSTWTSLATGISTAIGVSSLQWKLSQVFHKNQPLPLQSTSLALLEQMKKQNQWAVKKMSFSTIVLAPIFEEFVFRGEIYSKQKKETATIYQNKKEYWKDAAKNISLNAAFFSAVHYDWKIGLKSSLRLMPNLFLFGLAYGGLAEITGNLWAPTAAHMTTNALAFHRLKQFAKK